MTELRQLMLRDILEAADRPLYPTPEQGHYDKQAFEHEKTARRHAIESKHDDHPPAYQEMHRIAGKMHEKLATQYRKMAQWKPPGK